MRKEVFEEIKLRTIIKRCDKEQHFQQVAFSVFADLLTQICFECDSVRISKSV